MIWPWMLQAVAVAASLCVAAALAERVLLELRLPARGAWAGALLLSLLLPIVWMATAAPVGARGGGGVLGAQGEEFAVGGIAELSGWGLLLDRVLVIGWLMASLFGALHLLRAARRLRRARRSWREGVVGGEAVLISRSTGPAVAGALRPRIVMPEWALRFTAGEQALLVAHEREHVRAADPLLLLLGSLAVVCAPWNLALWWQVRRLRLAVEVDCDARVAAAGASVRGYGILLLQVGSRGRVPSTALPFADGGRLLERRIRLLTGERPRLARRARVLTLAAALTTIALPFAVSAPPRPELARLLPASPPASGALTAADATGGGARPELLNRHQAPEILRRAYPRSLREAGVGGTVVVWAYVDAGGSVSDARVLEGSGRGELDEAAVRAMRDFRFAPARAAGRPVGMWAQYPVTFLASEPNGPAGAGERRERIAIWTAGKEEF